MACFKELVYFWRILKTILHKMSSLRRKVMFFWLLCLHGYVLINIWVTSLIQFLTIATLPWARYGQCQEMHFHNYWSTCSWFNFEYVSTAVCQIQDCHLILKTFFSRFSHSPIDLPNLHIQNGSQIGVKKEMTVEVNLCYI